jgi:hypothetical protein
VTPVELVVGIVTIIALFAGPAIGVRQGQQLQDRNAVLQQRKGIFFTLTATRHDPFAADRIRALNMIDVAFHDDAEVRQAWKNLFTALDVPKENINVREVNRLSLELLSKMGERLGYPSVKQTDFDRPYLPTAICEAAQQNAIVQKDIAQLIRLLTAGAEKLNWSQIAPLQGQAPANPSEPTAILRETPPALSITPPAPPPPWKAS